MPGKAARKQPFKHNPARKAARKRAANAKRLKPFVQVGKSTLMYGQAQAIAHNLQHAVDEEDPET